MSENLKNVEETTSAGSVNPIFRQWQNVGLMLGVVGMIALIISGVMDKSVNHKSFWSSALYGYIFWLGMTLGCCTLTYLHHSIRAHDPVNLAADVDHPLIFIREPDVVDHHVESVSGELVGSRHADFYPQVRVDQFAAELGAEQLLQPSAGNAERGDHIVLAGAVNPLVDLFAVQTQRGQQCRAHRLQRFCESEVGESVPLDQIVGDGGFP